MAKGQIKRYSMKRKFGGSPFEFVDSYNYKSEAIHLKDMLRRKGAKVRIVKTKHGYEVWARK